MKPKLVGYPEKPQFGSHRNRAFQLKKFNEQCIININKYVTA